MGCKRSSDRIRGDLVGRGIRRHLFGSNDLRSDVLLDLDLHVNQAGPNWTIAILAAFDDLDLTILDISAQMGACIDA